MSFSRGRFLISSSRLLGSMRMEPDAFSSDVVITVAAHVRDQDVVLALRGKAFGEFPRLYAGHDAVLLVLDELRDAIAGVNDQGNADDYFHGAPGGVESVQRRGQKIARQEAHHQIRA